jgi:hypothetical protein
MLRQLQHLGGWIDSVEAPARTSLREDLELQATASPENQHSSILWRSLGQQQHRHALQIGEARHDTRGALRISRNRLRIGENSRGRIHRRVI